MPIDIYDLTEKFGKIEDCDSLRAVQASQGDSYLVPHGLKSGVTMKKRLGRGRWRLFFVCIGDGSRAGRLLVSLSPVKVNLVSPCSPRSESQTFQLSTKRLVQYDIPIPRPILNNYWMRLSMISRIIKTEVCDTDTRF